MSVTISQKNPKAIEKVLKRYQSNSVLAIGFPSSEVGSQKYPTKAATPVIKVAIYNNFGGENSKGVKIPRRDFMTPGGENAFEKTKPIRADRVPKINAGEMTVEQVLEEMGLKAAAEVSLAIRDLDKPPNAQATIDAKGSDNPLVDEHNLLMRSVTYVVRPK